MHTAFDYMNEAHTQRLSLGQRKFTTHTARPRSFINLKFVKRILLVLQTTPSYCQSKVLLYLEGWNFTLVTDHALCSGWQGQKTSTLGYVQ